MVIVRREPGAVSAQLPGGLNDLTDHNLITVKSMRESLDGWAMNELIGHFVAYRKLVGPWPSALLPESLFRRVIVAGRLPREPRNAPLIEVEQLALDRADVDKAAFEPRLAALVLLDLVAARHDGIVAGIDCWAAGQKRVGLGWAAVEL